MSQPRFAEGWSHVRRYFPDEDPEHVWAALRRGDLVICVAVVLWGVYTMVAKRLSSGHDMRVVTAWSLVCGAVWLAPNVRAISMAASSA